MLSKVSHIKLSSAFKLIPELTVVLEVLLIYPWFAWFGQVTHWSAFPPHMNFVSYIILALYVEVMSRFSVEKKWPVRRVWLLIITGSVLLWLVLFRWSLGGGYPVGDIGWFGYMNDHVFQAGVALLSGPLFMWRGIAISRQSNIAEDLYRKFIIGLVFVIILVAIWGFSLHSRGMWSMIGTYGFSYFAVGLLILAIANLERLSRSLSQHQEAAAAFRRRWSSMLVVLIVAILGISVAAASIFSTNLAGTIIHACSIFGDWVLIAFSYIIYPLGFVAAGMWYVFEWIISLFTHGKQPKMLKINMPKILNQNKQQQQTGNNLPPALLLSLKWTLFGVVIGLAVFLIGRYLMRYWQSKMEPDIEEENESLWSWVVFRADLRNLFRWLFSRLYHRKTVATEAQVGQNAGDIDITSDKDMDVREIYRSLLRRGRYIHVVRNNTETPYEYSAKLKDLRENMTPELDTITDSYVTERYGDERTSPERISLLNRLWRTLKDKMSETGSNS